MEGDNVEAAPGVSPDSGKALHPLAYAAPPSVKRPRWVEESGEEVHGDAGSEELWKFVRLSHGALANAAGRVLAGDAGEGGAEGDKGTLSDGELSADEDGAGGKEAPVEPLRNPQEVIDLLVQAKGDADVLVDVVAQVEGSLWLRPAHVTQPELPDAERWRRVAVRAGATKKRLGGLADVLRTGAAALRTFTDQDNQFYTNLARLQRNWSVQLTPSRGRRQSIFQVDISVAQMVPPINILKDGQGRICIEVETRTANSGGALGEVHVRSVLGLNAIHERLGGLQREQWWRDITDMMAYEVARRADIPRRKVEEVMALLHAPAAAASVAAYRPLVEQLLLTALRPHAGAPLVPTPAQTPSLARAAAGRRPIARGSRLAPGPSSSAWRWPATVSLEQRAAMKLMGAMAWLRHRSAANAMVASLADAAASTPGTRLAWLPRGPNKACTTKLAATCGPRTLIFVVEGEGLRLDGVLDGRCHLSWACAAVRALGRPGFELPHAAALQETGADVRQEAQTVFANAEAAAKL